ncbi:MAG TPA: pyridoxamine 5'-phosphate oxidase family protein [Thermodesulfobacteriota bacterium]|nr:pyridoxamine 5'-phosphate oxidase family protein [Thermodesulfobacteriota bacterium]
MKFSDYFKGVKGTGVLATADSKGVVDAAIYAIPHIIDEETVAFITTEKLTYQNLQSNPHAAYLFMEEEDRYKGIRLFLTKIREEKDVQALEAIRRKSYPDLKGKETLVYFKVDKVVPLIGAGPKG